ncbi:DASS family sodium-coupled anion symporter [Fulvimarina sp. 2208YS6-2-32]|uniref:DASS family sodium-coupled anion symporter n=1 Tax=Fulvimarina uroteuthidis TaxID=3098149 RepID=A0ABU5I4I9_9HYPH|nr:DASS family sodium-coupled anion symporter [Fulvimarina sp. 2208YS6-2-32]MDY8109086.1 DASS family sodium-coupled anion symporter [Fulvimarina sp. 2208YS6-2-32]
MGLGNSSKRANPGDARKTAAAPAGGSLKLLPMLIGLAVFVVLLLLPAPEGLAIEAWRVVAVASLMIVWWITEAVPVPATALLPLVLFPLTGAISMDDAAAPYADPTIFLFMGGFMLAGAMERWNLHRRIALNIVARTGSRRHHIVGGFMLATAFLSMWVSNTATTVMMLPIALSVVGLVSGGAGEGEDSRRFAIALLLGVAYSASIGGVATLIGTPPNALLAGTLSQTYGYDLGFGRWMLIGVPVAVLMLAISWLLLTRVALRLPKDEIEGAHDMIHRELKGLGRMSRAEIVVGSVFAGAAVLWILRSWLQTFIPGLDDAGIAIGASLILFAVPAAIGRDADGTRIALLDWKTASRLPWGILILFGGGLSLASAVSGTGLDEWIGAGIGGFAGSLTLILLVMVVATIMLLLTEFTSNTATAATFLPLLAALSMNIGENPLMLAVPAALSASMAFMMPVATPPNALVFSSGHVSIPQMVRYGAWHNVAALLVISTVGYLVLTTLFGVTVGEMPAWATGADAGAQ